MFLFKKNKELLLVFFITIMFVTSIFIFLLSMVNKPESYKYDTNFSEYKLLYEDIINKLNNNVENEKEKIKDYYHSTIKKYFRNKTCYKYFLEDKIIKYFKYKNNVIICSSNSISTFNTLDNFLISNKLIFKKNKMLNNEIYIDHYEIKAFFDKKELIYRDLNSFNSLLLNNEKVYLIERKLKNFKLQLLFKNYDFRECLYNDSIINKEICILIDQNYDLNKINKVLKLSFDHFISNLIFVDIEINNKKNYNILQNLRKDFIDNIDYNKFLLQIEKNNFDLNYLNIFDTLRDFNFLSLSFMLFILLIIFVLLLMMIKIKKN